LQRLEPGAGKLASSVLRGGWRSNALPLPDCGRVTNTAVRRESLVAPPPKPISLSVTKGLERQNLSIFRIVGGVKGTVKLPSGIGLDQQESGIRLIFRK
jgi:hypothetical protein